MKKNFLHRSMFALAIGGCFSVSAQTTFTYTGAVQSYTVGSGVTNVCVDALGASGGNSTSGAVDSGGKGARVECNLAVSPGQVLYIYVGGVGGDGSFSTPAAGGYNGGGAAGYYVGSGGGGATDIRTGGTALANRVVVAGGGGGAGMGTAPVAGYERGGAGGATGENGYYNNVSTGAQGGQGGSATGGGAGGGSVSPGMAGASGTGGTGNSMSYGGGGGGGYYGGGGGGFSGGGGGSSYVDATLAGYEVYTSGYNRGNGSVTIITGCLSEIGGPSALCISGPTPLSNDFSGGIWSCASGTATIGSSSGVVTGVSAGVAVISYTDGVHTVSKSFSVISCPSLGAGTIGRPAGVNVYPNPVAGSLTVTADPAVYNTIVITDNIGRVMLQQPIGAAQTNVGVEQLAQGLYYIQLKGPAGTLVQKFIKSGN